MFHCLCRFTRGYSKLTQPLRALLKKNAPILDPNKKIIIQCDASQKGLGCVLLQRGRPVSFSSRSLTDSETRYSQIEKELLDIVFAVVG